VFKSYCYQCLTWHTEREASAQPVCPLCGFVRRAADRFAILEKGHVIGAGPTGDLSDDLVHRHLAI
jgi:hypothetical protein